jgi:1-acyl-sn-glycerol-3-phosphate acyltransferase
MSIGLLILLTAAMLLLPRVFQHRRHVEPTPEIHGYLKIIEFIYWSYCIIWHRLRIDRRAPLPTHGPAILISNHTCGIDHVLLQAACDRILGFMVAREYYEYPLLNPWCRLVNCIPVNRDGRDFAATRAALRALKEGRVLPIFPEGHIVPESGRRIDEMKPGTAYLALHSGVPVIPAYLCGTPETDNIVKALLTPSNSRVVFGEPIDLSDIPADRPADKAAQAEVSSRFKAALLALQTQAFALDD